MIDINEITTAQLETFWKMHFDYLVQDQVITDDEDREYFQSQDYRGVIFHHMLREKDKHHIAYFEEDGVQIGAVSFCTYTSEDGKCFILDFWLFPQFRRKGKGHRCFEVLKKYTFNNGAKYYEINCDGRADRMNFWKSVGFVENGCDQYGVPLLIARFDSFA